jgi:transcriptional regulator of acetoin/glycerol metabolism
MEFFMEKFVERHNIARFTTLLMTETDTAKRELLQKLLTEEMVRQATRGDALNRS